MLEKDTVAEALFTLATSTGATYAMRCIFDWRRKIS